MTINEMLVEIESVKRKQIESADAIEVYELTCALIELQASVINELMKKEAA